MGSDALDIRLLKSLDVSFKENPNRAIVKFVGQVDVHARRHIESLRESLKSFVGEIDIHAQEVTFIDSYAVSTLRSIVADNPDRITLHNPTPTIVFLLETAHLLDHIEIKND